LRLITPLNRVLGLGTAKRGVEHWWVQRLTATALLALGLWFAISLLGLDLSSHAVVVAWIGRPVTCVLLILTVLTAVYHSYLGVEVVVEDYVGGGAKIVVLILSAFAHTFAVIAGVFSILKVAFGAV
jgi:succinate dehydrogenase / fumarate reductase membrane anchor subunit